jgi:hypothetical protein
MRLETITLPLALPIQRTIPMSINELVNRIGARSAEGLHLHLNYSTDYTAWFRLTKTVNFWFQVEMAGRLEEHGEVMTFVSAQTRVSLFTYAVTAILFILTLASLPSPLAGLFGLLCARMVTMLVVCTPDAYDEIAHVLDELN